MEHALFGMVRSLTGVLAVAVTVAPFDSNDTWRVDPRARSSRTFATIEDAVRAARSGDTIVVAPGRHPMPGVISKGLKIVGEPGAVLDPTMQSIRVTGLPRGERFVLAHFGFPAGVEPRIQLDGNLGAVHLVELHADAEGSVSARGAGLWIRDCRLVTLDGCSWFGRPGIEVLRSRVRVTGGAFRGAFAPQGSAAGFGLRAINADVELADVRLTGSDEVLALVTPEPALYLRGGTARLAGADLVALGGADANGLAAAAIDADQYTQLTIGANVRLNPGVSGLSRIVGTTPTFASELPTTRADVESGALVARATGRPWDSAFFFAGPLAEPLPTTLGEVWLDPSASIALGVLGLDARGTGAVRHALAAAATIDAGACLAVQAVVVGPNGVELGVPAIASYAGR